MFYWRKNFTYRSFEYYYDAIMYNIGRGKMAWLFLSMFGIAYYAPKYVAHKNAQKLSHDYLNYLQHRHEVPEFEDLRKTVLSPKQFYKQFQEKLAEKQKILDPHKYEYHTHHQHDHHH